jgi:hypothetical protein
MKKTSIITLLVTFALILSAWAPAAASSASSGATLTITNPLPKATVVTLTGAGNYTFTISANQTVTTSIPVGNYRYKYNGCLDKKMSGILPYKNGKYALAIPACKTVYLVIYTPYSVNFTGELKGWMNYSLRVRGDSLKYFDAVAGTYYLSYDCSNGYHWEGKVRLSKNKFWPMCTK